MVGDVTTSYYLHFFSSVLDNSQNDLCEEWESSIGGPFRAFFSLKVDHLGWTARVGNGYKHHNLMTSYLP